MKKSNRKIGIATVCVCLACLVFAVFAAPGCSCKKKKNDPSAPTDGTVQTHGTHERSVQTAQGEYFVQSGKTAYKIVIPSAPRIKEESAAALIADMWQEATGVQTDVVYDEGLTYSADARYISVGNTALKAQADPKADRALGTSGFVIRTVGKSVFLFGETDYATLYAAQDFLWETVRYEFYYADTYALKKSDKDIAFARFDITEVPDIEYRASNYGWISADEDILDNYRMKSRENIIMPVIDSVDVHNSFGYLPNRKEHPLWISDGGEQVCYTAHGDKTEYALMLAEATDTLKRTLRLYTDRNVVTMTIQDSSDFCSCPACSELVRTYGADSASVILFCNDLNREIRAWFATEEGKPYARDLNIIFFAYLATVGAPTEYNEATGTYTAKNGIHTDDGVSVFLAPIYGDFTRPAQDGANLRLQRDLESWHSVSDEMFLWLYGTDFKFYLAPYDTFNALQGTLKLAASKGVKYLFEQCEVDSVGGASTGWGVLKAWLAAKYAWNVNYDGRELTARFFRGYFGEGAEAMRAWFDAQRVHIEYLKEFRKYGGAQSCYMDMMKEEFWQKSMLLDFLSKTQDALDAIAPLRSTDPDRYALLHDNITRERVSLYYLLIGLYDYSITAEALSEYKQNFKEDTLRLGFAYSAEGGRIENLYTLWGI